MEQFELLDLDQKTLDRVLSKVHKLTGISMGSNKKSLLQGRLRTRMKKLGLKSYEHYLDFLDNNTSEVQEFINIVTTNETHFFRTQRVWDYFTKIFLPEWSEKNRGRTLKIWSGASSSGEEIFTIAICCEEHRQKHADFNYQILGTDISLNVINTAEKGVYSGRSIENFKMADPILFARYLGAVEDGFKVKAEIRSKVKFALHNLFTLPKEKDFYDIVFLRNVLIYFEPQDQEIVLRNISKGLVNDGILIIGESESLSSLNVPFKYKQPLIFEKLNT